jgi:hypothetical protein
MKRKSNLIVLVGTAAMAFGLSAAAVEIRVTLSGDQEVPAVATEAKGEATINIGADKSVSGTVKTTGVEGVAAHVHVAEPGKNGPPIITLTKQDENTWVIPYGAKLTDEQYEQFQAGLFYINIHSANHKSGEIRGQLKP